MAYSVVVIPKRGSSPKVYDWLITRTDDPSFANMSVNGFATPEEAAIEGQKERERLERIASLNKAC